MAQPLFDCILFPGADEGKEALLPLIMIVKSPRQGPSQRTFSSAVQAAYDKSHSHSYSPLNKKTSEKQLPHPSMGRKELLRGTTQIRAKRALDALNAGRRRGLAGTPRRTKRATPGGFQPRPPLCQGSRAAIFLFNACIVPILAQDVRVFKDNLRFLRRVACRKSPGGFRQALTRSVCAPACFPGRRARR